VLGLVPGLVLIVLSALLTDASIDLLVRFNRAAGVRTYAKTMGDAFGVLGRGLLQLCVIVNNLGILVVYMIIIGMAAAASMFVNCDYCFHQEFFL
jgi:sodium-coupled neutral amino acid transporter 2